MTDEQKLRELDKWICINVFGWEERQAYHGSGKLEGQTQWIAGGKWVTPVAFHLHHKFKNYTTDPAAAMEVLEKCQSRMDCEDIALGECCGSWSAYSIFRENKGVIGRIHVFVLPPEKLTLPLAIALFARQLFTKE